MLRFGNICGCVSRKIAQKEINYKTPRGDIRRGALFSINFLLTVFSVTPVFLHRLELKFLCVVVRR